MRGTLLLLGALGASGCAAGPRAAAPHAAPALEVSLTAQRAGEAPRLIGPGDAPRPGEQLAVQIRVRRPAYVQAIAYAPRGWSSLVPPALGEAPLRPGATLQLPEAGLTLRLDDQPGGPITALLVVASERPVREAQPDFCARLRLPCPAAGLALRGDERPPPPPPPEGTDPRDRAPEARWQGQHWEAGSDAGGVAVVAIPLPG